MEVKKENVLAAYNLADDNGKKMLQNLFPEAILDTQARPVTERIKTFEDAARAVGAIVVATLEEWKEKHSNFPPDVKAYIKLRIIVKALNEGWEPNFSENEYRYYPYFYLSTKDELDEDIANKKAIKSTGEYITDSAGFVYADSYYVPSDTIALFGSRLCLKSHELAKYCGEQFIDIWADFCLIKKPL